jgi:hypothetical protein
LGSLILPEPKIFPFDSVDFLLVVLELYVVPGKLIPRDLSHPFDRLPCSFTDRPESSLFVVTVWRLLHVLFERLRVVTHLLPVLEADLLLEPRFHIEELLLRSLTTMRLFRAAAPEEASLSCCLPELVWV